jgi:hypothetical protein
VRLSPAAAQRRLGRVERIHPRVQLQAPALIGVEPSTWKRVHTRASQRRHPHGPPVVGPRRGRAGLPRAAPPPPHVAGGPPHSLPSAAQLASVACAWRPRPVVPPVSEQRFHALHVLRRARRTARRPASGQRVQGYAQRWQAQRAPCRAQLSRHVRLVLGKAGAPQRVGGARRHAAEPTHTALLRKPPAPPGAAPSRSWRRGSARRPRTAV